MSQSIYETLSPLFKTFVSIFEEDRDFTSEEMDILSKYLAYSKEFKTQEDFYLPPIAPGKPDKDLTPEERKAKKLQGQIIKSYIKKNNEFFIFLVESIRSLSDKEIDPDILDLVYKPNKETQYNLFANSPEEGFIQQPKYYLDKVKMVFDLFTPEKAEEIVRRRGGEVNAGRDKLKIFVNVDLDIQRQVDQLIRVIKDPKHKKYYLALWNYAGGRNNRVFKGVKVSDIIKIAKPGKTVTYKDRLEFTEFLEAYSMLRMEKTVDTKIIKGKKFDKLLEEVDSINFFNVTHKRYVQKLDKNGNRINARTIFKIYGELPKDPYNIGYYIPETIFLLDGNQGERINLFLDLYRLKNQRFSYPQDPIRIKRFDLIRLARLEATDNSKPSRANELLLETLKLGYELKIIENYPYKLPLNDDDIIEIKLFYPQNSTTKLPKQYN